MKVAVTGATGFLGRALVRELDRQGHTVVCISRSSFIKPDYLSKNTTFKKVDYERTESLVEALVGCGAVVHLAGIAHSKASKNDLERYRLGICSATQNLISAAMQGGTKIMIFASSIKVYGESSNSITFFEDSTPTPKTLYGLCKLEAEGIVQAVEGKLASVIFRFPPLYGPGMKGSVRHLFSAAKLRLPLPVHNFQHLRNFLYLGNAVSLLIASVEGNIKPGIYNVYDLQSWTIGELYKQIYVAVHNRPLPKLLAWVMPQFLERYLAKVAWLSPLMLPFRLKSNFEMHWAKYVQIESKEAFLKTATMQHNC